MRRLQNQKDFMASSTSYKTMFVLSKDFIVFFILNVGIFTV